MAIVPIPVTGGAYQHPSQDTNNQQCVNMFLTDAGPMGRGAGQGQGTLLPAMGSALFTTLTGNIIRGIYPTNGYVFVVCGANVYRLTINTLTATVTQSLLLGTLMTDSGTVSMTNNQTQLFLVDGSVNGYIYVFVLTGKAILGLIGGTVGDTYTLTLNGITIYNNFPVDSGLSFSTVVTNINNYVSSTGVSAQLLGNLSGTCTLGVIGGHAGNTYSLTINGTPIFTTFNVSSAMSGATLVSGINTHTAVTGVTASYTSPTLTLTTTTTTTEITIVESGTGFTQGTNGITVTGGSFASGDYAQIELACIGAATIINVVESGTGFTQGTNGITVTGGSFASGAINSFAPISSPNFLGGLQCLFIDQYFVYCEPGTAKIWNSALSDGTTWNSASIEEAESIPDIVLGIHMNKGEMWVFCAQHIEVWYDAANPAPASPFLPRAGSYMDIGVAASNSIAEIDNTLMWLDTRGFIVLSDNSGYLRDASSGYLLQIVSTPALHAEFATYSVVSDAIAMSYIDRGHLMYQITFPTAGKTWVYDHSMKQWHQRTYYNPVTQQYNYHLVQYCTQFGPLLIGGGLYSGNLYLMSSKYYDDAGQHILRKRVTAPFNKGYQLIGVDCLFLRIETGLAPDILATYSPTSGGYFPQVVLRYSHNGGHTWSYYLPQSFGAVGQYGLPVTWNRLGTGREWILEFTIVDPVNFSIIDAYANIGEIEMQ